MKKINRIILIVLDSLGIGALPDAKDYNDEGVNTLLHILKNTKNYFLPNLERVGLLRLVGIPNNHIPIISAYGKMAEKSVGKDTTIGHWELMGCINTRKFPTYPNGFPDEIIQKFERLIGKKTLGNIKASGTEIINKLGEEHIQTGYPIVYTSADSIFQIAAHENIIPIEALYKYCEIARNEVLVGKHSVLRVVARPFLGKPGNFYRTKNRHDFSLKPICKTVLEYLKNANINVHALGKINDIYAGTGITSYEYTSSNMDGLNKLIKTMNIKKNCLIFLNLVDFDMKFGHRRDIHGYYQALYEFDLFLPKILNKLFPDDLLILTADHGCDPTHKGTDHTREYVPVIIIGNYIKKGYHIKTRESFSDLGKSILSWFNLSTNSVNGLSFSEDITI